MNQHIIVEIQNLLKEIQEQNQYIYPIININYNIIEIKLKTIESMIYKKPVSITAYTNLLVPIVTKDKCIMCNRNASYIIINNANEKMCWIHSQILI